MTRRRMVALLGVPLLMLASAWVLGGALFSHPPADLGSVVTVRPDADRLAPPASAPSIGSWTSTTPSTPPGHPQAGDASSLPGSAASTANPEQRTQVADPTGAIEVPSGPAPTAGDDDDDDDGIDDDTDVDDDTSDDDSDGDCLDDDTDN